MSLQVTFGIEPVQYKTDREGENQNQYQRVDAHAHAPVPLQVRDIRTENASGSVTDAKYLPGVAKISQMTRTQSGTDRVPRRPLQVGARECKAPAPGPGARNTAGDSLCPIYACRPSRLGIERRRLMDFVSRPTSSERNRPRA
jgi:hypothetical protein